jgi:hypothetical protein
MDTLTLEQVRKAARFAWNDDWSLFVPGLGALDIDADAWTEDLFGYRPHYGSPQDGWHHLPGCDCEFCRT